MFTIIQVGDSAIRRAWNWRLDLPQHVDLPPSEAHFLLEDQQGLKTLVELVLQGLLHTMPIPFEYRWDVRVAIEKAAIVMLIAASMENSSDTE